MEISEIINLIQKGESETVEFKKSIAEIDSAFKTVCAFLNTNGGVVFIGVLNNGNVVGQPRSDSNQQAIANSIKKIQQNAKDEIEITYPNVKGKSIICICVKKGKNLPYTYETRAYERVQNITSLMTYERQHFFITNNQHGYSWESLLADKDQINSLDKDLIKKVIYGGVEKERLPPSVLTEGTMQILKKFGLVRDNIATNAAVILFGKDFLLDYPQTLLKLARFKGFDRAEFIDKSSLYGNIFYLLDEAMYFIRRNLPVAAKIEEGELERKETALVPLKALREAIVNALCHRDYSSRHGDMGLAIYEDRLEITNSGGLLPGLTVEQIKKGEVSSEQRRNPLIAHVLDKCGYIERWGRGIREIIKACKEAGNSEPMFFTDNVGFKIIFKFPNPKNLLNGLPSIEGYFQKLKERDIYSLLTVRQLKIITLLFSNGLVLKPLEVLEKLKEPISDRQLRRDLLVLKRQKIVGSRGKAQAAEWFIINE